MPVGTHSNENEGSYQQSMSIAGYMQLDTLALTLPTPQPATIAGGGNWNTGLIFSDGYRNISVGVTLSQAGSLVITRYIDRAGTVAQAASTTSIVASTALIVNLTDGLPYISYSVQVNNSSGSTGTLSGFAILMSGS